MPHEPKYIRKPTSKGYEVKGVRVGFTPEGPLPSGVCMVRSSLCIFHNLNRSQNGAGELLRVCINFDRFFQPAKLEGRNRVVSGLNSGDGELSPAVSPARAMLQSAARARITVLFVIR